MKCQHLLSWRTIALLVHDCSSYWWIFTFSTSSGYTALLWQKWLLKAFVSTDLLSCNEPLTPLEGRCKPTVLVHICTTGRDFSSDGIFAKPTLAPLLKYLANILKAFGLCFNGCLADYCIGSLLHNCRLCLCTLRVRWILGQARASQERGQLQLMFGCRYSCSARSKELSTML